MRRFWSNRKGNVAIIFALVSVPLFGVMGAAIDYSMASAYRADIQKALDATALALTKIMPANQETLDTVANQYFFANLNDNDLSGLKVTVTPDIGLLRVTATGTYTVKMASIIGGSTIDIGAKSEAKWSMGKVEIALVLDSSLSMETPDPARIQALRAATVNLINVLENAAKEPGDAKVGIVAFDGMVNVGYNFSNAPGWIRWDWWDANAHDGIGNRCKTPNGTSINFSTTNIPGGKWLNLHCSQQTVNVTPFCQGGKGGNNASSCKTGGGTWVTQQSGVWTPLPRNQWAGCVYDRNQNHDVTDTLPSGPNTYYPAARCYGDTIANGNGPPQAITALTEDWTSLRTKATALKPTGYTNITIGLAWGWHVLSPGGVYTEGAAYDTDDLTKYVILMTDGYNTKNIQMEPGNCNTNGPVCPVVDNRTAIVCENIKHAGIKIYTVRLIDGNANLLRDCASSANMYYDVQNAGQLSGVFSAIGSEIASLHLSK